MEALLWNSEQRWPWLRHLVHQAMADPAYTAFATYRTSSTQRKLRHRTDESR